MKRAPADRVVWIRTGVAAGAAAGAVVLAALDSAWALLCAVGFLGGLMLLAISVGMTSRP